MADPLKTAHRELRIVEKALNIATTKLVNIEDLGCQTAKPANVEAFLRAVTNDASHGTYYAACSDEFSEMAAAVLAYFEKVTEADGADMPGLDDLREHSPIF